MTREKRAALRDHVESLRGAKEFRLLRSEVIALLDAADERDEMVARYHVSTPCKMCGGETTHYFASYCSAKCSREALEAKAGSR